MDKKKAPAAKAGSPTAKAKPEMKGKAPAPATKGKGGASAKQMDARDKFKEMIAKKKEAPIKKK